MRTCPSAEAGLNTSFFRVKLLYRTSCCCRSEPCTEASLSPVADAALLARQHELFIVMDQLEWREDGMSCLFLWFLFISEYFRGHW